MHSRFFYYRGLSNKKLLINENIKEISLIAPYFYNGTTATIIDLLFEVSNSLVEIEGKSIQQRVFVGGRYLYEKYIDILLEAQGLLISGCNFQYEDYEKRVLLNHAIGFMKIEQYKNTKASK